MSHTFRVASQPLPLLLPTSCLSPSLSSMPARDRAPAAAPGQGQVCPGVTHSKSPGRDPATGTSCTCRRDGPARAGSSEPESGQQVGPEGAPAASGLEPDKGHRGCWE